MQRNKHGLTRFEIDGHLLLHWGKGSWNLLTAHEFGNELKRLSLEELAPYWVILSDVREWEYCPPDVWGYFDELYLWVAEHGMIGHALVYKTQMLKHFMSQLDNNNRQPTPYGQHFSTDYEEAKQWFQLRVQKFEHKE